MTTKTLQQVQSLVDQLTPLEQVRLLEYLAPRIRKTVANVQTKTVNRAQDSSDAWEELFRVGDEIANSTEHSSLTMTQLVSTMRR